MASLGYQLAMAVVALFDAKNIALQSIEGVTMADSSVTTKVDVQKIMKEIRDDIEKNIQTTGQARFLDSFPETFAIEEEFEYERLAGRVLYLKENWNVNPNRPLVTRGGIVGKALALVKKVFRKCMRFYIEPYANGQNFVNANTVECLDDLCRFAEEQKDWEDRLDGLEYLFSREIKKPFNQIRQEYKAVYQENKALRTDLHVYKEELQNLRSEMNALKLQVEVLQLENKKSALQQQNGGEA